MKLFSIFKKSVSVITAAGFLLMFTICSFPASASGNPEMPYTEISDAKGLAAIANAPDGNYRLIADIDIGACDWKPIQFRGKLDGNGHTVYNLHVTDTGEEKRVTRDGNLKEYDTEFAGLFSVMENAEVTGLTLKGALVDISGKSHCFAAILAGYCDNCTLNDCHVEGRVRMKSQGVNAGVAGVVGYGNGIFKNCEANVELVYEDQYRDGKCEQFLGGILACGIGIIHKCNVKIDGYVSCHGYAHNGGIIGMYFYCGMKYTKREITYCFTEGQISFFEDNDDRRAYCMPIGGEILTRTEKFTHNDYSFKRNETKDYSKVLSPEKCKQPDYEDIVTPSSCTEWGFTEHRCRECGYSWIDSYTPPQHDAGEWIIVSNSDFENEGLKRLYCQRCGELIDEEIIPVKTEEKPQEQKTNHHIAFAVAVGAGILLAAEAAAVILTRKKKKAAAQNAGE